MFRQSGKFGIEQTNTLRGLIQGHKGEASVKVELLDDILGSRGCYIDVGEESLNRSEEKIMRNRRIYNIGLILGASGLILLLLLILSGAAYPSLLFKVLAPMGIFLTFAGFITSFIGWIRMTGEAIEKRSYSDIKVLLVTGIIIFLIPLLRILFSR